jgi:Cysteine-rich CWC
MKVETTENLICEACGESFECGAKTGKCWCFEIDLSEEKLANLKENFDKCLCPKCLISETKSLSESS